MHQLDQNLMKSPASSGGPRAGLGPLAHVLPVGPVDVTVGRVGGRTIRGKACTSDALERAGLRPQVRACVPLDEGVTMLANIVDRDLDGLRIGNRMRLIFRPTKGGVQVPMFRPALPSRPAGGDA